jgi:hypothetical protein
VVVSSEVSERVGEVVPDKVVVCFDFFLDVLGFRMCIMI